MFAVVDRVVFAHADEVRGVGLVEIVADHGKIGDQRWRRPRASAPSSCS